MILSLVAVIFLILATLIAGAPIKLTCIGNSVTAGFNANGPPYPERLGTLLGSGYQVQNAGVIGATLLKKGDHPYWNSGLFAQVFAYHPADITIQLGINDSKPMNWRRKADFAKDLRAFIDTLSSMPSKPKIWLCLPTPSWHNAFDIQDSVTLNEIIPILRQIGIEKNLSIIDLRTPWLRSRSHFPDGVHPDSSVQDSISKILYRAMKFSTAPNLRRGIGKSKSFPNPAIRFESNNSDRLHVSLKKKVLGKHYS